MKKNNEEVKVFIIFRNFIGEVTDKELIATFRNINWAKEFICQTIIGNGAEWEIEE